MAIPATFPGFPPEYERFYSQLKRHNEKAWFDEHRDDYEDYVLGPAREFVAVMGRRLRKVAPGIHADPRVNRSIFRIHRDTRFSPDKTPYKTHLALWFWEGKGRRMECSGFYFHLEPSHLMLGVGIYLFPKPYLSEYRNSVVDPKHGRSLAQAVARVTKIRDCRIGGHHYRRIPRGFDPEHRNAEFLKFNGLYAGIQTKIPRELHTPRIIDYCYERYRAMAPLHRWLLALTERGPAAQVRGDVQRRRAEP